MGEKVFMQGNMALAEAAIRAGCKYYFGYPITPASEIMEYYAAKMPEENGVFVQAETEVSASNMIAGVAAAGKRAMMATSGPGISLGAEAISYMCAAQLPAVLVNVMRPGPGDGDIVACQGDYFQAVKGAGHGDYNTIVLAPYSAQEMVDFAFKAFELAEKYRNPVMILSDGGLAKMMESVELPDRIAPDTQFPWALTGAKNRDANVITTCAKSPKQWEEYNLVLQEKFIKIKDAEQKWESYKTEDADVVVVAFGISARIAFSAVKMARDNNMKVGMIRPITLWPFPEKAFKGLDDKYFFVTELNSGQMVEDVKLSVKDKEKVSFYGRLGGMTPTPKELYEKLIELYKEHKLNANI
ncbi:MAG TPA: 3-methyl-2-oxobutanoate dehydrogenase subunit VorB [Bacillota bacterium]|nr:3-methyl-2-oxobutanoate dehydrogenase subunit VorB [Bacillota bacterium]HNT04022.1 3-methyl-2-oxobutanoate dehydrogenase subunit VorB [Bacillota bacterium]HPA55172.1 3-methyl-2-oxobutanoate dehydrogenase subunit VorB [Bacillota bacterium]HPX68557.1 3-methyl-2-oxobutanoate dehydrogenase subunit VorB [Bacillota bacterium]HQA66466.1 3-methyl-2-oxobutanoate dehydrogenase subunit VorB [Bacillota bacterium]